MTMDELSDIVCSVKGIFSIDLNGGVGYIGGACSFHGTGQCQSQESNNIWNDAILDIKGSAKDTNNPDRVNFQNRSNDLKNSQVDEEE